MPGAVGLASSIPSIEGVGVVLLAGSRRRRVSDQQGAVTAEAAVVMPLLVVLVWSLIWLVSLGVAEARVDQAAREVARAIARGEEPAVARSWGEQVAPAAQVRVTEKQGVVRVEVFEQVRAPGGLWRMAYRAAGTAVTFDEGES